MENNNPSAKNNTVSAVFGALKKNWILILVIIILFACMGVMYTRMQNSVYTAREKVFYTARNIVVDNDNSAEHVNAARAYIDTVADFCNEENSVKRADYMYGRFLAEKELNPDLTANDFLDKIKEENRKYTYNELTAFIGSNVDVDVFYTVSVEENKRMVDKTFSFNGKIVELFDQEFVLQNPVASLTVKKSDFLYAKITESYKSEYAFYDLSKVKIGQTVKVFTYEDAQHVKPIELVGEFQNYDDYSCTVKVDGVSRRILRENFKKLTVILPSYFYAGSISVDYEKTASSGDENFIFTINYTDVTPELAMEKVKFIISAIDYETKLYATNYYAPAEAKFIFFKNVEVSIVDAGYSGYSSSVSFIKNMVVFLAIGVLVGVLSAYLKELFDNTVKTKEDLEHITGVKMLSAIPVGEGKK